MKYTPMTDRKWWRWPENYYGDSTYLPWYQIVRRLISVPFLAVALVALCLIVLFGWGRDDAREIMQIISK